MSTWPVTRLERLRWRLRRTAPRLNKLLCRFGFHHWTGSDFYMGPAGMDPVSIAVCGVCGAEDPEGLARFQAARNVLKGARLSSPYRGN